MDSRIFSIISSVSTKSFQVWFGRLFARLSYLYHVIFVMPCRYSMLNPTIKCRSHNCKLLWQFNWLVTLKKTLHSYIAVVSDCKPLRYVVQLEIDLQIKAWWLHSDYRPNQYKGLSINAFANYFKVNLFIALAYFIVGKMGLMIALPPGYSAAIWPAAGIATAFRLVTRHDCLGYATANHCLY